MFQKLISIDAPSNVIPIKKADACDFQTHLTLHQIPRKKNPIKYQLNILHVKKFNIDTLCP
jgi:hypothetical protein